MMCIKLQHYVGEDGDYNPFEDNGLLTVYTIFVNDVY